MLKINKYNKLLFSTVVNCNICAIETLVYKIAVIIASTIMLNAVCVCLTGRKNGQYQTIFARKQVINNEKIKRIFIHAAFAIMQNYISQRLIRL